MICVCFVRGVVYASIGSLICVYMDPLVVRMLAPSAAFCISQTWNGCRGYQVDSRGDADPPPTPANAFTLFDCSPPSRFAFQAFYEPLSVAAEASSS